MFDLSEKVALVTGGGSGIGQAICRLFGRQGAAVHILDHQLAAAEATAEEIRAAGGKATAHLCDVTQQAQVRQVVDGIAAASGRIDILVNNAGISHIGTVASTTEEDFERVFRVNVKGVYNCAHCVVPHMKARKRGSIINLGSVAANLGIPDRFAYSMSKGAVQTMTYCIARDCLADGIRCNSVAPARVHTPFVDGYLHRHYPGREGEMFEQLAKTQPIGRMGTPEEIAQMVLYLAADESSFITGSNLPIDGGFITLNT